MKVEHLWSLRDEKTDANPRRYFWLCIKCRIEADTAAQRRNIDYDPAEEVFVVSETVVWQRASKCSATKCVEVARVGDQYLIRSSEEPGVVLCYTPAEWDAFVHGAKAGEFDF